MTATDSATIYSIDLSQLTLEPEAIRRIPRALALRHDILSLSSEGNEITIAVPDASDRDTIERVRLVTGMHVRAVHAPREAIREKLSSVYAPERTAAAVVSEGQRAGDAPAIRMLDQIHAKAVDAGASDVHIEPARTGGRVRQRVDGILCETKTLGGEIFAQVVSRIKLLAGMDIADRRQPQDGRYVIDLQERSIDARVSSMPTITGEKLVIRLLDHSTRVPSLEDLGMPGRCVSRFRRMIHAPHGFIVVCGPTGSGKTTTLYAAMAERNVNSQNLCSVEDPVEIRISGIAQVQVNPRAGVTFASALRAFLRQDPNVIMVGEMRDEETAAVAASASLSGQLVLTTLHCNDAPKAIDRLIELGVSCHTLAAGLTGIVAQRLVRRLCTICRVPYTIDRTVAAEFGVEPGSSAFRSAGCQACDGSGYAGRSAIFEFLFIDDHMRALIAGGGSSVALAEVARKAQYQPMIADGVRRALAGETTFDEILRVLLVENRE